MTRAGTLYLDVLRSSLAGLHLKNRLRAEPCQRGGNGAASFKEQHLEPFSAYTREAKPRERGSARLLLPLPISAPGHGLRAGTQPQAAAGVPAAGREGAGDGRDHRRWPRGGTTGGVGRRRSRGGMCAVRVMHAFAKYTL